MKTDACSLDKRCCPFYGSQVAETEYRFYSDSSPFSSLTPSGSSFRAPASLLFFSLDSRRLSVEYLWKACIYYRSSLEHPTDEIVAVYLSLNSEHSSCNNTVERYCILSGSTHAFHCGGLCTV